MPKENSKILLKTRIIIIVIKVIAIYNKINSNHLLNNNLLTYNKKKTKKAPIKNNSKLMT